MHNNDPNTTHYGKALMEVKNDELKLIVECSACGRQEVNIPLVHLGSTIQLLQSIADTLGIDYSEDCMKQETVEKILGRDPDSPAAQAARARFDAMDPVPPWAKSNPERSLWDEQ